MRASAGGVRLWACVVLCAVRPRPCGACAARLSASQALNPACSNHTLAALPCCSSHHRNSEELYSGYSRTLGGGTQQQGSPCRCCGRTQQPTSQAAQLPPPHPALQHGAQQLQQQYAPQQPACHRRRGGSVDFGAPPRAPLGRRSVEVWGESSAAAAARADVLASLAVRTHKRKSEEVLQPPPASHARLPATATNWRVAMGSSFYSSSAPQPPQAVQPKPEAEPQPAYK